MHKWLLRTGVAFIAVIVIVLCYLGINKVVGSKSDGTFTFEVKDANNIVLVNDDIDFQKGDNAWKVIFKKYPNIKYNTSEWGVTVMEFSTIVTDFSTSYIALYVNGEYATTSIEKIELKDKIKISFVEEIITW